MSYNPGGQPPYQMVGQQQQPDPSPGPGAPVQSGAFQCPECGAELEGMEHRRKHAVQHWGNGVLPVFPSTRLARERYAALVDQPVQER